MIYLLVFLSLYLYVFCALRSFFFFLRYFPIVMQLTLENLCAFMSVVMPCNVYIFDFYRIYNMNFDERIKTQSRSFVEREGKWNTWNRFSAILSCSPITDFISHVSFWIGFFRFGRSTRKQPLARIWIRLFFLLHLWQMIICRRRACFNDTNPLQATERSFLYTDFRSLVLRHGKFITLSTYP